MGVLSGSNAFAHASENAVNLAPVAVPTSQVMTSENRISALNDGFTPENSLDRSHALYALWADPSTGKQTSWVQYEWNQPVSVNKLEVYWAVDRPRSGQFPGAAGPSLQLPQSYRILYWNGNDFAPVNQPQGLGAAPDTFNATTFEGVKTSKVRLETVLPQQGHPAAILEWRVFNFGPVPVLPAGDRCGR